MKQEKKYQCPRFQIETEIYKKFKSYCALRGISMRDEINKILEEYFKGKGGK